MSCEPVLSSGKISVKLYSFVMIVKSTTSESGFMYQTKPGLEQPSRTSEHLWAALEGEAALFRHPPTFLTHHRLLAK